MDFVVSKVAMAVSALLVAAVLAGVLDDSMFVDRDQEIARVLSELCRLVENAHDADAEIDLLWSVPMMPTGAELKVTLDGNRILGESGGFRAVAQPMCEYHTWRPTTDCLNRSIVEERDSSAPVVDAYSGQVLRITAAELLVDSSEELMVFVLSDV
ncbi:MAG: hypothetical protein A3K60_08810 [Euryarchaeota archaeon RBG_19FT_COMBO_56_21]|nr:MAG: hypothetical protein A3K60_08810 [Euryarchaeota archaeon RBG_19FT_COMBO_56_21]